MIEGIAMLTVLAGMGFYFVKSTDVPKDLRDRSAQHASEVGSTSVSVSKKKYSFPEANNSKVEEKKIEVATTVKIQMQTQAANAEALAAAISAEELRLAEAQLAEAKKLEKIAAIERQNKKIDELTLAITALEQELKGNLARNAEIQAQIDWHLTALSLLNKNKIA